MALGKMFPRKIATKKTSNIAKKALKMAKGNRTFEVKSYSQTLTSMTGGSSPDILYLEPPTSEGQTQTIQNITAKIYIEKDILSTGVNRWRVDLVLDRQPNGVIFSPLLCYEDGTPTITTLTDYDNKNRFKIVKSYAGGLGPDYIPKFININYKSGLVVDASAQPPNQANVTKNAYYLVYWTPSGTNTPKVEYEIRIESITA